MSAAIAGAERVRSKPLFWEYGRNETPFKYPGPANNRSPNVAVRDGDWKLIEWFGTGNVELFNLANDLAEKHNLAKANPDKVKELQAKLAAWRKEVNAIMPKPGKGPSPKPARGKKVAVLDSDPNEDS